jgi:ferrous iron transport protein B
VNALEKTLVGLDAGGLDAKELRTELDKTKDELNALPASRLRAEVNDLAKQLEKLPRDPAADLLREQIASHRAALERLDANDSGAKTLQAALDALTVDLEKTPSGAIKALLDRKREELDVLPETQIEAEIADVDNKKAVEALRSSYAGQLGIALEPLSAPAGFDWRSNIALLSGLAAKEVVVATLGTAYSLGKTNEDERSSLAERIRSDSRWTTANAVALLLFTLLYSPCFVTLVVIRQESGEWKWMFFSLFFNLGLAYAVAVAANQAGLGL